LLTEVQSEASHYDRQWISKALSIAKRTWVRKVLSLACRLLYVMQFLYMCLAHEAKTEEWVVRPKHRFTSA
jgi:hypothetical protein